MTTATKNDWTPRDDLATRVVILRTQMGLNRRQFAHLTGLSENQLQGMEDGRSPHKLPEKIQAIHKATGVSREWLMWGGPLNGEGPRPDGPDGETVRHQGLEPRTRWYAENARSDHSTEGGVVPLFPAPAPDADQDEAAA